MTTDDTKDPSMTTTQTAEPEQPFDPEARVRVRAYLDARKEIGQGDIIASIPTPSGIMSLRASDLDQDGAQLAYAKDEARLLAEKCGRYRARIDELEAEVAEREDDVPARIAAEAARDQARTIARRMWSTLDGGPTDSFREWVCPEGVPAWLTAGTPEDAATDGKAEV